MKYWALVLSLFFLSACSEPTAMHESSGKLISQQFIHGKWLFVNIWAPWCHPCRDEIPALNAFYKKHHNQVVVIGSDYDLPAAKVLEGLKHQLNIGFPVLVEPPFPIFHIKQVGVVPTTFVINPSGQVVRQLVGPHTLVALEQTLTQVLAEASAHV